MTQLSNKYFYKYFAYVTRLHFENELLYIQYMLLYGVLLYRGMSVFSCFIKFGFKF